MATEVGGESFLARTEDDALMSGLVFGVVRFPANAGYVQPAWLALLDSRALVLRNGHSGVPNHASSHSERLMLAQLAPLAGSTASILRPTAA